jgi:hypothetical protein
MQRSLVGSEMCIETAAAMLTRLCLSHNIPDIADLSDPGFRRHLDFCQAHMMCRD